MSEPSYRKKAEALMGTYLDALAEALEGDDVKAATLREARQFLTSQGIDVSADGSAPAGGTANRNSLLEQLNGIRKTGTE